MYLLNIEIYREIFDNCDIFKLISFDHRDTALLGSPFDKLIPSLLISVTLSINNSAESIRWDSLIQEFGVSCVDAITSIIELEVSQKFRNGDLNGAGQDRINDWSSLAEREILIDISNTIRTRQIISLKLNEHETPLTSLKVML